MKNPPRGNFFSRTRLMLYAAFMLIAGSILAVQFTLWGIEEIHENHTSSAVFCFFSAAAGLCLGCFAVVLYRFNKNAKLEFNGSEINIKCGWGPEFSLPMEQINRTEIRGNSLILFTDSKTISINALLNAVEICRYIEQHISKKFIFTDTEAERKRNLICRKKARKYLILTVVGCAFLFINIGLCIWLTGGKDLEDFSHREDIFFIVFMAVETFTVCVTLLLAKASGKAKTQYQEAQRRICAANAYRHRKDELKKYVGFTAVKYFKNGLYRIVIFSPHDNVYAYMLERFDEQTAHWHACYKQEKAFEFLSELYEDLKYSFSDVVLEDECRF